MDYMSMSRIFRYEDYDDFLKKNKNKRIVLMTTKAKKHYHKFRFKKNDISSIEPGKSITVLWRGKPIFIKKRTSEEIAEARAVKLDDLPDPQKDEDRVKEGKDEWLVMLGVCTHLGCVPLKDKGDFNGWFCPCHGSHYDVSGRIRKGPAPTNMEIPKFEFVDSNTIKIG